MEPQWDEPPVSAWAPFSKDVLDRFSLAPTVQELWAASRSPDAKVKVKEESKTRPGGPFSEPKSTKTKQTTPQTNTRNNQSSDGPTSDCSQTPTDCGNSPSVSKAPEGFPDPEVPYPRYSSLNIQERTTYIQLLKTRNYHTAPQPLMEKVNKEVAEFMNYLQDVSKVCADAYKRLPSGASRYSEEYFKACLDHMKTHPQVYTIQEITSLTGGKFVSDISLNFEKQLLAMGNIEMVEKRMLAEDTQLTVDCDSLSDVISPCEKARRLHTAISSDTNAEKLSATYEPHVCLAKEAFLQLVNNDAGCAEAWELPVWVKVNGGRGRRESKTAYIDPPLLKTEVTWRERNLLFHEESVKLAYKKTGSNPVFFLTSEDYANKVDFDQKENGSRTVVSFDSTGLDFEVDVTDLESFGESCQPCKRAKDQSEPKAPSTNGKLGLSTHNADLADQNEPQTPSTIGKLGLSTPKADLEEQPSSQPGTEGSWDFSSAASTPAEEEVQTEAAQAAAEEGFTEKCADTPLNVGSTRSPPSTVEDHSTLDRPPAKRVRHCSVTSSLQSADSDEEHLVIDYPESLLEGPAKKSQAILAAPESPADSMALSLGEKASELTGPTTPTSPARGGKRGTKRPRVSGHCDQLGQILRMQDAMLKAAPSKGLELPKTQNPAECRGPAGRGSNHPTSLVKPCVSSYLESGEGLQEETCAPAPPKPTAQRTRLLRAELQVSGEDESDYEPPAEASLLYKLYSLQDVLLMVRSSVHIAHPRHDLHVFRAVPVHVLPKLEYQLCYGGESLTHSEACQLWAEQQLHSSTVSFIGRINARTSKVVQLQELPADWIQNTSCDFRPARCLNTLYHILKKVMSLQEGRYLLGHKPGEAFVTVFKATDGKKPSRSAYDLRAAHAGLPVLPADGRLSWLPLDPLHLMPFHIKHRRAPCTFPPRQPKAGAGKGAKQSKTTAGPKQGTQSNTGAPGQGQKKKKKKKKKRKTQMWKRASQKGTWTENMKTKVRKDVHSNQKSNEN
ncbi:little elongation complex subunit 2 isoform X2 [Electrophorus electricus]|uniref:little elongation complex subunit 2 isoform X2 n=1 Tax=Electrophorus electricus TaxID=8005 RepID=UPI0015D02A99|nr:little elongation complex subunit 2 isoform X2 [Electrophorus electricus]